LEKCCDIIVHKAGTSFLDLKDIIKIQQNKNNVITKNNLEYFLYYLNETNITTIFTNGCFDILHRGHIEFLKNCKNKADLFILGLNSDESVRLNKGDKRPIIPLEDRIYNLNALKIIDFIIIYDEKTPELLLSELKPAILAKGDKDYTTDNILGKEHAMQTIVISTERYFDTTQIINTILKNYEK
jgi:D-beta-D-heptose 7-phosphate kinase/D-beta-D-heptose 1-phosphate adenosyltransferase